MTQLSLPFAGSESDIALYFRARAAGWEASERHKPPGEALLSGDWKEDARLFLSRPCGPLRGRDGLRDASTLSRLSRVR